MIKICCVSLIYRPLVLSPASIFGISFSLSNRNTVLQKDVLGNLLTHKNYFRNTVGRYYCHQKYHQNIICFVGCYDENVLFLNTQWIHFTRCTLPKLYPIQLEATFSIRHSLAGVLTPESLKTASRKGFLKIFWNSIVFVLKRGKAFECKFYTILR